jgi:deoxyribonuclease IV
MWLGAHIGIADGLPEAVTTGRRIGCEVIQIFSKSPQMWSGPPLDSEVARSFREAVAKEGLRSTAVHQSYLPNLATPKAGLLKRSRAAFLDELRRAEGLGIPALIFHPGAHTGAGVEVGLKTIVESLNDAIGKTEGFRVRALLENAAGAGTALGSRFEELATVLDGVTDRARVGIALDTCHLFAAGFDFRTPEQYGELRDALEATIGCSEVRAFHLNDSKGGLGGHLDRHENIGKGMLGLEGFRNLLNDSRWNETPGYLETPLGADDEYAAYAEDLRVLRSLLAPASPSVAGTRRPRASTAPRSVRRATGPSGTRT